MEYHSSNNNQTKHKRAGRSKGIRSKKYSQALQEYFSGNDSIAYIAKKHNIDRSGLSKAIKSTKKSTFEILKDSEFKNFQSQELREQIFTNVEIMQELAGRMLGDLEMQIDKLKKEEKFDLDSISQSASILQKISKIIGFSEMITQIYSNDVSKQNNQEDFKVHVEFVDQNFKIKEGL